MTPKPSTVDANAFKSAQAKWNKQCPQWTEPIDLKSLTPEMVKSLTEAGKRCNWTKEEKLAMLQSFGYKGDVTKFLH
jgi:hypothetical protein